MPFKPLSSAAKTGSRQAGTTKLPHIRMKTAPVFGFHRQTSEIMRAFSAENSLVQTQAAAAKLTLLQLAPITAQPSEF
jgi:hypothetical protein